MRTLRWSYSFGDVPDVPHRIYTELKNTLAGFNSWVEEAEEWISEAEEKQWKITLIEQKGVFFKVMIS